MNLKVKNFLIVIVILVLAFGLPVMAVTSSAQAGDMAPVSMDSLLNSLKNLTGVAMLIAVIVNIFKALGVVKDGQAGTWSAGLNILVLLLLFIAQITGYAHLVPAFDEQANQFSQVITAIFAFVYQLFVSRKTHDSVLAGIPLIGMSYSGKVPGETITAMEVAPIISSAERLATGAKKS